MAKWKGDPFTPKVTHYCDKCGQQSTEPMPIVISKHVRNDTQDHKFCSRECHNEFYIARMRRQGL
jgi:hypothetical protein